MVRCRTYATPNRGFLKKTLGHLYFMVQAVAAGDAARARRRRARGLLAHAVRRRCRASSSRGGWAVPFVIEVRDLWPAIFVDLGVIRNRAVIRVLEQLELFLYRRAAAVVTVTRAFAEDIARRGIARAKLHVDPERRRPVRVRAGPARRQRCARGWARRQASSCSTAARTASATRLARMLEVAERLRGRPPLPPPPRRRGRREGRARRSRAGSARSRT